MTATPFRFKADLGELPKGSGRAIIEQFRAVQNDLDNLRGAPTSVTPFTGRQCTVRVGELLLLAPTTDGVLVGVPPATALNITRRLQIALVGGVLSPGATVSIVGGKGTINGAATLSLTTHRLVELVSCGPVGWFFST